jgi:DNA-binding response OmpR family regulator
VLKPLDSIPGFMPFPRVLCLEPDASDRESLNRIFEGSIWPVCPDMQWEFDTPASIESAVAAFRRKNVAILLCDGRTGVGTWQEVLNLFSFLTDPPLLIVTSRLADERLWAEALNLGAYDVLAKPYYLSEVVRVVSVAWLTWQKRHSALAAAESHTGMPLPPAPPLPSHSRPRLPPPQLTH